MRESGGVTVLLHLFLTLALGEDEWFSVCPIRLISRGGRGDPISIEYEAERAPELVWTISGEETSLDSTRTRTPDNPDLPRPLTSMEPAQISV